MEAGFLTLASGCPTSSEFLGVIQRKQQPCGASARNNVYGERRHPSLASVVPRGVENLRCDGGPSGRLPLGAGVGEYPYDRLSIGVDCGGVLFGLCDRGTVSSFSSRACLLRPQ